MEKHYGCSFFLDGGIYETVLLVLFFPVEVPLSSANPSPAQLSLTRYNVFAQAFLLTSDGNDCIPEPNDVYGNEGLPSPTPALPTPINSSGVPPASFPRPP